MNGRIGHVLPVSIAPKRALFLNCLFAARRSVSTLRPVPVLESWDPVLFEESAYKAKLPARLPRSRAQLPPACEKWFIHDEDPNFDLFGDDDHRQTAEKERIRCPRRSELRTSFWSDFESTFVPLEVTTRRRRRQQQQQQSSSTASESGPEEDSNKGTDEDFQRIEAPLKALLAYLSRPLLSPAQAAAAPLPRSHGDGDDDDEVSIYLAQCDLSSLPESLQADVPLPHLLLRRPTITQAIKGDIYASSLWLGRPPTYTPLHRDPNPNLFLQLVGMKTVRLLPPEVGDALFHEITSNLSTMSSAGGSGSLATSNSKIRGEEMMVGAQKAAVHGAIWPSSPSALPPSSDRAGRSVYNQILETHGLETSLGLGDALFIPKGWWHSVKGVGEGVTASVNWWFR